jgi:acetyltransferase-like isoleucine patch superfamily enzyme
MGQYVVNNREYSIDELLEFNISIWDMGSDNRLELDEFPKMDQSTSRLEVTFRGDNNNVRFEKMIAINNCVKIRFLPQPNMPTDNCDVHISEGCLFNGRIDFQCNERNTKIFVGNDCLFANNVILETGDSHTIYSLKTREKLNWGGDICIGNHVWIAEDVKFLKNSSVNDDSVVGARAVVTKKFYKNNIVIAGVPAKIIKEDVNWDISCGWR